MADDNLLDRGGPHCRRRTDRLGVDHLDAAVGRGSRDRRRARGASRRSPPGIASCINCCRWPPTRRRNLMPDRARWGHLDLLNIVGRGSYGTVYRAWDTRLERLVALKLFHGASESRRGDAGRPHAGARPARERRHRLRRRRDRRRGRHLDGAGARPDARQHREGQRADAGAAKRRRSAPTSRAALGAVHAAGLLHCDVKAQNVVRESGGRVVLMDLGAGRLAPEARDADHAVRRRRHAALHGAGAVRQPAPPRPRPPTSTASACCCTSWCRADSRSTARRSANCARRIRKSKTALARRSVPWVAGRSHRARLKGHRSRSGAAARIGRRHASRAHGARERPGRRTQDSFVVVGRDPDARRVGLAAVLSMRRHRPPAPSRSEYVGGDADHQPHRRSVEAVSRRWSD